MLKRLGGAALIVGLASAPLSANAARGLYSYQGSGHGVRVEYKMTKGGESRHLYNYKILNNRPDAYGDWVYPT